MADALPQTNSYPHVYRCMYIHYPIYPQSLQYLNYSQASRLSMNIRALTVERGIAVLANQSRLSTLLSFSSRGGGNRHNAGGTSMDVISSPTGIPARQGEEELEGGYYDEEDDDVWFEGRDNAEDEEIIQEDRSMTRRGEDVERAARIVPCDVQY
jgi:hypothetical protein